MARIRTIKPEFWTSEQVMECSPLARLLFIGLWNFADDEGRLTNSTRRIKAQIFPSDDISSENVLGMLQELNANDLVHIYDVENIEYIQITGWHHQRIDHPATSILPAPTIEIRRRKPAQKASAPRTFVDHSRLKGRERKGKDRRGIDNPEAQQPTTPPEPERIENPAPLAPPPAGLPLPHGRQIEPITPVIGEVDPIDAPAVHARLHAEIGDLMHPLSVWHAGDVIGWMQAGADLELDVLPVIGAKLRRKPGYYRSLGIFASDVAQAVERRKRGLPAVEQRRAVGDGLSVGSASTAPDGPDWSDETTCRRMFGYWRDKQLWVAGWGPPPGKAGCRIPEKWLQPWLQEIDR